MAVFIILINYAKRLKYMGGFTCDILAIKIGKLFKLDFQNILVLLRVIRWDMFLSKMYTV
jgi:hypothetical protein